MSLTARSATQRHRYTGRSAKNGRPAGRTGRADGDTGSTVWGGRSADGGAGPAVRDTGSADRSTG